MKAMKSGIRFLLLFVALIGGALLFINNTNAAVCDLSNVTPAWVNGGAAINIGQTVRLSITPGSNCFGQSALIDLYEEDQVANDFIKSILITFGSSGATITDIKFTSADYAKGGNESVYENMYAVFKLNPDIGTRSNKTPIIKLYASTGCGGTGQPVCPPGSSSGVIITNFDINPKQVAVGATGKILITYKLNISNPAAARDFCANSGTFTWYVEILSGGEVQRLRSGQLNWPTASKDYNLDFEDPFNARANGTIQLTGVARCASQGKEIVRSASATLTVGTGGPGSGGGFPPIPATASQSYTYVITNPLAGGPNDLFDIINIVTQWIMYISIPLAVLFIMYAGFLMLTAGPVPANFQKGRDILKYVILGLAIIFIGKGFVSLIISIIELGGTTPTTQTQGGTGALGGARSMGWTCSNNNDCNSGLKCQNTMCVSVNGNIAGEPCLSGDQCAQDFTCDNTTPAQKQINGRTVGTCFRMLCSPTTNKCTSGPKSGQTCANKNDCE